MSFTGVRTKSNQPYTHERNWLIGYYIVEYEQKGKARPSEESSRSLYPQMEKLINTQNQDDSHKYASVMPKFTSRADDIISHLSFTHLREIMSIDTPLVRYFYEQECIRCTWSVRELRRQIGTNLHIRVGLSKDPEKSLSPYKNGSDCASLQIREPYTFEFLGLKAQDVVTETDLEYALIKHLQEFLLEFGKGMC